jgi:hypothetical protein
MGSSTGGGGVTRLPGVSGVSGQVQSGINKLPGQGYGNAVGGQIGALSQAQANANAPQKNPYAAQTLGGAITAQGMGGQTAQGINGFAQGLIPYAQQIEQTGMDPQGALYARTLQQVQDQQRVANAKSGVASSPFGAGLEGDASRNFNIDWQNQQLNRQTQAATAAEGLGSSAFNLGSGAADLAKSSASLPYQTQQGQYQARINALSGGGPAITQASQPQQQAISDFLGYLGLGPGYQSSAAAAQQAGTNQLTGLAGLPLSLIAKH